MRNHEIAGLTPVLPVSQMLNPNVTLFLEACVFLPRPIGPVTVSGQIVVTIVTPRIVKEIGSGAETMAVDHPSGGLRGLSKNINAVCRCEIPKITLCFSASFYQVLVGPLDSEEHHNQARWEQLPEEENDPKHDVGLTADLLHVSLMDREPVDAFALLHVSLVLITNSSY